MLFSVAAVLIASVSALDIITPNADTVVDVSSTFPLQWTTVATDPKNFTLAYTVQDSSQQVPANSLNYQSSTQFVTLRGEIFPSAGEYTLFLLDAADKTRVLAHTQPFKVTAGTSTVGMPGLSSGTSGIVGPSATSTTTSTVPAAKNGATGKSVGWAIVLTALAALV